MVHLDIGTPALVSASVDRVLTARVCPPTHDDIDRQLTRLNRPGLQARGYLANGLASERPALERDRGGRLREANGVDAGDGVSSKQALQPSLGFDPLDDGR
jgi:hypothetical protein